MEFTKMFKAGLLASTSALALAGGMNSASAQGGPGSGLLGLYGGVGIGWESNGGKISIENSTTDEFDWKNKLNTSGIVGSIFGGYRMMVSGPWVIGGELKFGFGGSSGDACGTVSNNGTDFYQDCGASQLHARSKFGLNANVQLGYLMSNGMLPFVKVGYAGKSVHLVGSVASVGTSVNSSKWLNGIEFGGGIDIPIGVVGGSINLPAFIRADASYTVFGRQEFKGQTTQTGVIKYGPNTFQAGVSFGVRF